MFFRIARCDLGDGVVISVTVLCTPDTPKGEIISKAVRTLEYKLSDAEGIVIDSILLIIDYTPNWWVIGMDEE